MTYSITTNTTGGIIYTIPSGTISTPAVWHLLVPDKRTQLIPGVYFNFDKHQMELDNG